MADPQTPQPGDGVAALLLTAVEHHNAGRLPEAEALYRQILAIDPNHVDALHNLGYLASQVGRDDIAVELIGRATTIDPTQAVAFNNLGNALAAKGAFAEALAAFHRAASCGSLCASASCTSWVAPAHCWRASSPAALRVTILDRAPP